MLILDPAQSIGRWLLGETINLSDKLFQGLIFAPVHWNAAANQLFVVSRTMAVSLITIAICWGLIRTIWPVVGAASQTPPGQIIGRAVSAVVIGLAAMPVIRWLLQVNNAIVAALSAPAPSLPVIGNAVSVYSPLLSLLILGITVVLLMYLGMLYAFRTIEIFVLTALTPWMAVVWILSPDDSGLRRLCGELVVAIFLQSVHAAVFWLFSRMLSQGSSVAASFEAVGVLWYMTKIPGQLRRLLGVGGRSGLWQWK